MVAKIISGKSLIGALNYNENKVGKGKAELIGENGFQKDMSKLNFYDKLIRLTNLAAMNERVTTNSVHISLNFAPEETLPKEKLGVIASDYMERIGFGNQPFLVYQHRDAGHPHVHIVTTNIKHSGERISLHNIGRIQSETARKAIEKEYGLVPATREINNQKLENNVLAKVEYGKTDTKRAITNVINAIIKTYKFTSLPEFNAVLRQYNVAADRGSKESRMFAKNGLLYWTLDNDGHKTGVPIKASSIYGNPTLKNLQERFRLYETLRKPFQRRVKSAVDSIMRAKASPAGFKQALQAKGIEVIFRINPDGRLYGVTYVDHQLKVVFNGSDLGKVYSANALNNWFDKPKQDQPILLNSQKNGSQTDFSFDFYNQTDKQDGVHQTSSLIDDLIQSGFQGEMVIPGMNQNKRKKKRRRLIN